MTNRRTRTLAVVAALVAGLGACRPLPHVPVAFVAAPAAAVLSVSSPTVARQGTVEVTASGCDVDFAYVEVRLVVGAGDTRRSAAVTTGGSGEPIEVAVPGWAPTGPAVVEASCLEPNFSRASDGADIKLFDYASVAVQVAATPAVVPLALTVPAVTGEVLRVSGTDCGGGVLVAVSRGPWLVASAAEFHFGRTLVTAAPDGSWSVDIPLQYSVGPFTDPVAPGTMSVFAVCEGQWYPGETFEVAGTAPAVQSATGDPSLLYLSQCPVENTLSVVGVVDLPSGYESVVVHRQAGPGYGETFVEVPLPDGAEAVTWYAGCGGAYAPQFSYEAAHWSA